MLPFGDAVLLRYDRVRQLLGEIVQLGKPIQVQVRVVEAVVAHVVVDIGDLHGQAFSSTAG